MDLTEIFANFEDYTCSTVYRVCTNSKNGNACIILRTTKLQELIEALDASHSRYTITRIDNVVSSGRIIKRGK